MVCNYNLYVTMADFSQGEGMSEMNVWKTSMESSIQKMSATLDLLVRKKEPGLGRKRKVKETVPKKKVVTKKT